MAYDSDYQDAQGHYRSTLDVNALWLFSCSDMHLVGEYLNIKWVNSEKKLSSEAFRYMVQTIRLHRYVCFRWKKVHVCIAGHGRIRSHCPATNLIRIQIEIYYLFCNVNFTSFLITFKQLYLHILTKSWKSYKFDITHIILRWTTHRYLQM